ncbi:MAG: cell division protein SepF [Candidatus Thermoplasmatota archaeon]|jgi:SepF-like predicted cell division protein (DUF552 family)|nr:cell division protein SepF [Candidatus Thermoplasmatota archaeon]
MANILKRGISRPRRVNTSDRKFIDLHDLKQPDYPDIKTTLKVAEIYKQEDVRRISDLFYGGNILLIDCSAVSKNPKDLKSVTEEVMALGEEVNGDVAAMKEDFLIFAPKGIAIDRNRIKGYY